MNTSQGPFELFSLTPENEDILRGLAYTDGKVIAMVAFACGWAPSHIGGGHGPLFIAVDGTRMSVPIAQEDMTNKNLRSNLRKLIRHRAPGTAPMGPIMEWVNGYLKLDPQRLTLIRNLANEAAPAAGSPVESVPDAGGTPEQTPVATPPGHRRKRRIQREEPWSAHTSPTREGISQTYPSDAVMERTWNDGTTDYACRWEGCDWTNDSPHSTARHFASHKRGEGRTPLPEPDGVDLDHQINSRRQTRINKLRREVDGALTAAFAQSIDWSVVDQAEWIATWIIDHRVEPVKNSTDEEDTELTPEQILDKIAALADRGRGKVLREQVDTLSQQTEDYLLQIDEAKQEAALAVAKAKRVEGNLHALRDMLNESANEDEDNPEVTQ